MVSTAVSKAKLKLHTTLPVFLDRFSMVTVQTMAFAHDQGIFARGKNNEPKSGTLLKSFSKKRQCYVS